MSITKTYTLNGMQQLVDLNGELKNFKLTFHARSQDGSPFHAVVVDQTTLDSNPSLEFRDSEGEISAEIHHDQDVYQNYFLVLKSKDKPCKVDVLIDRQEIAPRQAPLPPPPPPVPRQAEIPRMQNLAPPPKNSGINWKVVILAIVIIGGGALLYYFYMNKKTADPTSTFSEPMQVANTVHVPYPVVETVVPSPPHPVVPEPVPKINESLLSRLKNLPMH